MNIKYVLMLNKQLQFICSVVALPFGVILKMMDMEKLRLVLSDVTDCFALIASVFVADTVVFHVIPRLVDIWTHMKFVEKNENHIRLINLPR